MMLRCVAIFLLICGTCFGQEDSVGRVVTGSGVGSCVIVKQEKQSGAGWVGLAVTAHHVVIDNDKAIIPKLRVEYKDGSSSSSCYVVSTDEETDLAVIRVWMPECMTPAELSELNEPGTEVAIHGMPYGEYGTRTGKFLRNVSGYCMSDIICEPGYSGGGVFHDGKLAAVISGGWFWIKHEGRNATWPTRAGNAASIRKLLERQLPQQDKK